MSVKEVVDRYYDAWKTKKGDFSDVPLADDLVFKGPVASFDSAAGYRAMALEAGPLVTKFEVRDQVVDGNRVWSIIDWEMGLPVAPMTSAEILEVVDGKIVRGELDLRRRRTTCGDVGEGQRQLGLVNQPRVSGATTNHNLRTLIAIAIRSTGRSTLRRASAESQGGRLPYHPRDLMVWAKSKHREDDPPFGLMPRIVARGDRLVTRTITPDAILLTRKLECRRGLASHGATTN